MVPVELGTPARGLAFIRRIATEDTYRGGQIVVPDQAKDKIVKQQFEVVAVGDDERCEEEECERPHHEADGVRCHFDEVYEGDWVLVRNRAWQATPDPNIYVVKQDDILGKFIER